MASTKDKLRLKTRRHARIRAKVSGTTERPRLAVFRSNRHIVAQVIDDSIGHTIVAASTVESTIRGGATGNVEAAKAIGTLVAERAKEKGITTVVFDRGGSAYHGRVAALAEAARAAGLEF
jgi:large subunit ribosomal protein L18